MALQPLDFLLGIELDSDLKVTQVAPAHLTLASQVGPQEGLLLAQIARCGMTCSEHPAAIVNTHCLPIPSVGHLGIGHAEQPWPCGWNSGQFILEVGGHIVNTQSVLAPQACQACQAKVRST